MLRFIPFVFALQLRVGDGEVEAPVYGSSEPDQSCHKRDCTGDESYMMQFQIDRDNLVSGEVSVVKHLRSVTPALSSEASEVAMLQSNATRSRRVAAGLTRNTMDVLQKLGFAFKHKFSAPELKGVPFFGLQRSLGGRHHDAVYNQHDQWILHFSPESKDSAVQAFCKSHEGIKSCGHRRSVEKGASPRVAVLRSTLAEISRLLSNHSVAAFLERDGPLGRIPAVEHEDETAPEMWGLDRIDQRTNDFDHHYEPMNTGKGTHVYVFDTGIRAHRDFTGRAVPTLDLTSNALVECASDEMEDCGLDTAGHGTHCAGVVASKTYGVAKEAQVHGVKVLTDTGYGHVSWFVLGAEWVANHGERPAVVSASVTAEDDGPSAESAVGYLVSSGVPVIVAAGNAGEDACSVAPANSRMVMTVGSVGPDDKRSWFSNSGPCVDLYAPGSTIRSTTLLGTEIMSGTSTAGPFVAGAVAMLLSQEPDLTPSMVTQRLMDSSTKTGDVPILFVGSEATTDVSPPSILELATQRRLGGHSDFFHHSDHKVAEKVDLEARRMHSNLTFTSSLQNSAARVIAGRVTFERAMDESETTHYNVYFGSDDHTRLEGRPSITHINVSTSSDECGEKGQDKDSDLGEQIVNGKIARPCEFKWQVRISHEDEHYCAGSLISDKWVLTAAHCVETWTKGTAHEYSVTIGDWNMKEEDGGAGGFKQVRTIHNAITHGRFSADPGLMDYALIELETPVEFNECIGAICLPTVDVDVGKVCEISGWGTTRFWFSVIGSVPGHLQKAQVAIWDNAECEQRYKALSSDPVIMPENLCARGEAMPNGLFTDACQGDSGGPLACKTTNAPNGTPGHTLQGVISWGIGCGSNRPGVYSRVSMVTDWVKEKTGIAMKLSSDIPQQDIPSDATHLLVYRAKGNDELGSPVAVRIANTA